MWFTNKKWILEHCGKGEKDVRWLDRAIKKGVVYHDVEWYDWYILSVEYIEELKKEIEELKNNKSESIWSKDTQSSMNSNEVKELKEHLRYIWNRKDETYASLMRIINAYSKWDRAKESEMLLKIWYKDDWKEDIERQWASEKEIL